MDENVRNWKIKGNDFFLNVRYIHFHLQFYKILYRLPDFKVK